MSQFINWYMKRNVLYGDLKAKGETYYTFVSVRVINYNKDTYSTLIVCNGKKYVIVLDDDTVDSYFSKNLKEYRDTLSTMK